jgi:hypothetical protein
VLRGPELAMILVRLSQMFSPLSALPFTPILSSVEPMLAKYCYGTLEPSTYQF